MVRLCLGPHRMLLAAAISALLLAPAPAQDHIAQLQAQFNRESDPIRKAKAFPKLGEAQLGQLHREIEANNYDQAVKIISEYRDEVRSADAALKASGVNAERKPAGFKQLQIHLRKSLREIDEIILTVPDEQRPPFAAIRDELLNTERHLFNMLFPRQSGKDPGQAKRKG